MSKKDGTEATTNAAAALNGSAGAATSANADPNTKSASASSLAAQKSDKDMDAAFSKHASGKSGSDDAADDDDESDDEPGDDDAAEDQDDEDDEDSRDDSREESEDEPEDDESDDQSGDDEDDQDPEDREESPEEDESRVPKVYRGLTPRQRIEKARAALALSELFTQAEIDKMPKEEVLRRGAKILKQDEAFKKLKAEKTAEPERTTPKKNPRSAIADEDGSESTDPFEDDDEDNAQSGRSGLDDDDSANTPERSSAGGLDKVLRKVAKDLQLRDEETSALGKQVREVLKAETQKYSRQLAQAREDLAAMKQQNGELVKTTVATRFRSGVQSLQSEFPMLKDVATQKRFAKFVAEHDADGTKVLSGTDAYAKFLKNMAWAAFGHRVKETVRRELVESSTKARKGSVDLKGSSPTSRTALTEEQFEDAAFRVNSTPGLSKAEREKRRTQLQGRRANRKS